MNTILRSLLLAKNVNVLHRHMPKAFCIVLLVMFMTAVKDFQIFPESHESSFAHPASLDTDHTVLSGYFLWT